MPPQFQCLVFVFKFFFYTQIMNHICLFTVLEFREKEGAREMKRGIQQIVLVSVKYGCMLVISKHVNRVFSFTIGVLFLGRSILFPQDFSMDSFICVGILYVWKMNYWVNTLWIVQIFHFFLVFYYQICCSILYWSFLSLYIYSVDYEMQPANV